MSNPWRILRITPTRDLGKIKAAYRAHAQQFHPDKARTPGERECCTWRFIELRNAYIAAKRVAQYEGDLQLLNVRRPPDLSENVLLSNDWFMATVVIVAGLFGFWLLG